MRSLLVAALVLAAPALGAQDVYQTLPLKELTWTDPLPRLRASRSLWGLRPWPQPFITYQGEGEAFLGLPPIPWWESGCDLRDMEFSVRTQAGCEVRGILHLPVNNGPDLRSYAFRVPMRNPAGGRVAFLRNRFRHYDWLLRQDLPGAAWFRHQAEVTRVELAEAGVDVSVGPQVDLQRRNEGGRRSYDLFSGGRAVAENLALDRVLTPTDSRTDWMPLEDVTGITTPSIDWTQAVEGLEPALDPLAARVPADQHAAFFPSLAALGRVLDEVRRNGMPVLELIDSRSEDFHTQARYERQLCFPLDTASRTLGEHTVESLVATGSDPYLRTGTDLALIIRARQPERLERFILDQQARAAVDKRVRSASGMAGGLPWRGVVSQDREVCSYVARVEDDLILTNSLAQLERLGAVVRGETAALASLDEYVFFRDRYPLGVGEEDVFLILSDATIRRWCSPRWRIAAARRTRAAAVLAEQRAADLAFTLRTGSSAAEGDAPKTLSLPEGEALVRSQAGPLSAIYGMDRFLTPIVELPIERVTISEFVAYERFRSEYGRSRRNTFDPIAARLAIGSSEIELDLSVIPLQAQTDYWMLIDLTSGGTLSAPAPDADHGMVAQLTFALDKQSPFFRDMEETLDSSFEREPSLPDWVAGKGWLGWLGSQVSILIEDDQALWKERIAAGASEWMGMFFWEDTPLAVRIQSTNPLGLAAFMAEVQSFLVSSWSDFITLRFDTREHEGQTYWVVSAYDSEGYFVMLPGALVLSRREDVLQGCIERHQEAADKREEAPRNPPLNGSANVHLGPGAPAWIDAWLGEPWGTDRRILAWQALPILNEWRRLAPTTDPVAFHEAHWGVTLTCPGEGTFVWNEEWRTLESTIFGHPADPRRGIRLPAAVSAVRGAELGVTFEGEGLRARARILR